MPLRKRPTGLPSMHRQRSYMKSTSNPTMAGNAYTKKMRLFTLYAP